MGAECVTLTVSAAARMIMRLITITSPPPSRVMPGHSPAARPLGILMRLCLAPGFDICNVKLIPESWILKIVLKSFPKLKIILNLDLLSKAVPICQKVKEAYCSVSRPHLYIGTRVSCSNSTKVSYPWFSLGHLNIGSCSKYEQYHSSCHSYKNRKLCQKNICSVNIMKSVWMIRHG